MTSFLLRVLAAAFALSPGLVAQDEDRQDPAPPVVLRVVDADDDTPRPGVELVQYPYTQRPRLTADGLVVAEWRAVAHLRSAEWRGRTDPEGKLVLDPASPVHPSRLEVAAPYRANLRAAREEDHFVLRVTQQEPVGLVVVDEYGSKQPLFPVALHGDGRPLSIGLTDPQGRALLALEKGYTARVVVAPAGWIGSLDGFPTLAEALPGKRGTTLKVPPHGRVRVRFERGGVPARLTLTHLAVRGADGSSLLAEPPSFSQTECAGFELPLVALGTPFVVTSSTSERWSVRVAPLTKHGEVADYVADLGPTVSFTLQGEDLPQLAHVHVRLVTDIGSITLQHFGSCAQAFSIPCNRQLEGSRLQRIEVDVQPVDEGASSHWAFGASLPYAIELPRAEIGLGAIRLETQPAPLRGRVVDDRGSPTPGAQVVVTADGANVRSYVFESGADGTFVVRTPPFRDANGALLGSRAGARLGTRASAQSDVVPFGGEIELRLDRTVAAREPDTGTVAVVLRDTTAERARSVRLALLRHSGIPRYEPRSVLAKGTDCEVVFEGVAKGDYSLCALLPERGPVVVLDDLACDGKGACEDFRLQQPIGLEDRLRTVEFVVRDAECIPIVGARIVGRYLSVPTDGTGTARIPWNHESKGHLTIEKPGMRPVRLREIGDRHEVTLAPPGAIDVTVVGIPDGLEREHVVVWVRGAERGNFEGNQAQVGVDGVAHVALPVPGSYRAVLLVQTRTPGGGTTGTAIAQTEPFAILEDGAAPVSIALDEAAIARLREAVLKAKAGGR